MKNKQNFSANNGVTISYKVETNERIKIPFFNEIMFTLLVIIASVGAIMTFATILNYKVMAGVVIPFIVGFSTIYTVLYKLIKERKYFVIVGAAALALIIALLFFKDFAKGVVLIFDDSRNTIGKFMAWDEVTPTYSWEDSFYTLTNFVTIILSMVLCSAISYFTLVKQNFIAIFLLTFPFFEIGAAFGAVPNYVYFSFMLASWAASLTISRVANAKIKMRRSNGKKQKKNIDGNRQKFAGIAVIIAMVVVLLFTAITTYLDAIDFTRAEDIDKLRLDTQYAFEDFIDYVSGNDRDGSLKEGKLYAVDDRQVKNRHYITMQTNLVSIKEPLKIKGYTATTYRDNRWNQTDSYDSYQKMFNKFEESKYNMGSNTGELIASLKSYAGISIGKITMSDFRRRKPYAYEVYFSDLSGEFTPIYDTGVAPEKKSKYTYTTFLSANYLYKLPETKLYDDKYKAALKEYSNFVENEYTSSQVTASVKDLAKSFQAEDKYDLINQIRTYLKDNIKHTVKSGKCPKDADFIENFLFTTKKGYSTHFASAAAVLMQAAGYPARYVEGYYIAAGTFNSTPSEHDFGYKTIDITDKYAHAWIEIYDETYGWIPVEVTPGYWSDNVTAPKPKPQEKPEEEKKPEEKPEKAPETLFIPTLDTETDQDYNVVDKEVNNKLEWSNEDTRVVVIIFSSILFIAILIAAALLIKHYVLVYLKKKIYASDNVNDKIKYAYKYLVMLAGYQKFKIDNVYDYMALAEEMGEKVYYITTDRLKEIFNIFLRHAYSNSPATLEEANSILEDLNAYTNAIYKDLNKKEKFIYEYLLNLL